MKNTTIFLIFMTLLASCSSNTIYDEPKDLIPKDSMVLLLKDLYLATSAKSIKNKKQQKKISYTPLVYNTYKIDSLRFSTSNFFYTSKVDVYEPMLDQVMALLKKEQVFFTQAKKIKDSIFNDSIKKKKITLSLILTTPNAKTYLPAKAVQILMAFSCQRHRQ